MVPSLGATTAIVAPFFFFRFSYLEPLLSMTPRAASSLLLSIDFEDWNQIVDRLLGHPSWDTANKAFPGQVEALMALFESLGVSATFFVLGMTAKNYPSLVAEIVARGHEVASHGFAHEAVYAQSPEVFRDDLQAGVEVIERITGKRPTGYRAPMYSLTRSCVHALETLCDLGFTYDSSQFDSRGHSGSIAPVSSAPFVMRLPSGRELWEVPMPTVRLGGMRLPVGGGSYWRVLPKAVLARALRELSAAAPAALYFHPYEFGPAALKPTAIPSETIGQRAGAAWQRLRYNPGRALVARRLRSIAGSFTLLPYGSYLARISTRPRPATLSREGVLVR